MKTISEDQIEDLAIHVVDGWDQDTLVQYAIDRLIEFYGSDHEVAIAEYHEFFNPFINDAMTNLIQHYKLVIENENKERFVCVVASRWSPRAFISNLHFEGHAALSMDPIDSVPYFDWSNYTASTVFTSVSEVMEAYQSTSKATSYRNPSPKSGL